ncbi:hypothetical protein [Acetonema longum]|uniref:Uncharacterized protein n=1 Tax=Acetonema longum DSM 6540 TaxID=1009370 RepID=F7NM24_9FIRM|nr:hypothetical protein [Acetonema longum]EGO62950.1 hypothetical protein ALO_15752 [Acetonema longum DSM 6540]
MADGNKPMSHHLRSARQWLTKAEESFDNDRQVSGELNLLLAQAELEHVKEVNREQRIKKYSLLLHGLALTVAVCFTVVGFYAYGLLDEPRQPTPIPAGETSVKSVLQADFAPNGIQTQQPIASARQTPATDLRAAGAAVKLPPDNRQVNERMSLSGQGIAPAKSPVLSREEMRQIIQAADKSLRGE